MIEEQSHSEKNTFQSWMAKRNAVVIIDLIRGVNTAAFVQPRIPG